MIDSWFSIWAGTFFLGVGASFSSYMIVSANILGDSFLSQAPPYHLKPPCRVGHGLWLRGKLLFSSVHLPFFDSEPSTDTLVLLIVWVTCHWNLHWEMGEVGIVDPRAANSRHLYSLSGLLYLWFGITHIVFYTHGGDFQGLYLGFLKRGGNPRTEFLFLTLSSDWRRTCL